MPDFYGPAWYYSPFLCGIRSSVSHSAHFTRLAPVSLTIQKIKPGPAAMLVDQEGELRFPKAELILGLFFSCPLFGGGEKIRKCRVWATRR